MTKADLNTFRKRLETMVKRLGGESTELRHQVGGGGATGGPAVGEQFTDDDLSRKAAEEEVALSLLGNEEKMLAECRAALIRLEAGTFGRCVACGKPVAKERLATMPYASHCIRCAREFETRAG